MVAQGRARRGLSGLAGAARSVLQEAVRASLDLYKIMIPLLIVTRVLEAAGVVTWMGAALEPVMRLVGLPGSMGLVWATALLVGTYGALLVFANLAAATPLTVAQTTILLTMTLLAHSLPVETVIARKAGMRLGIQLVLRVGGAIGYGWILSRVYAQSGALQTASRNLLAVSTPDDSLWGWAAAQVQNLASIFVIILAVMALLRLLQAVGAVGLLTRLLDPGLRRMGIGKEAIPITMVGILLGLSFGGALIIQEARSGRMEGRSMFFALALMCLVHSVIEDTLTMAMFGAHLSGLLWGRLAFSTLVLLGLVKAAQVLPEPAFRRFFYIYQPNLA